MKTGEEGMYWGEGGSDMNFTLERTPHNKVVTGVKLGRLVVVLNGVPIVYASQVVPVQYNIQDVITHQMNKEYNNTEMLQFSTPFK